MDIEALRERKTQIEQRFGPWTADDIQLADEISTVSPRSHGDSRAPTTREPFEHEHGGDRWQYATQAARVRRIVQIISDIATRPFRDLRILDLACLEGGFSIELAMRGAAVVGIEGRQANIAKADFAREALSLDNVRFILADVRDVTERDYGRFDVVLCLGILYHLNAPEVFTVVDHISQLCDGFAIVDTELALRPEISRTYDGKAYWGRVGRDHPSAATEEEKASNLWMSLDNDESFVFTRSSLANLLQRTGFSSIYEGMTPVVPGLGARATFVAIKGQRAESLLSSPSQRGFPGEHTEVTSGGRDSELHVWAKELSARDEELRNARWEMSRVTNHPYVRAGLALRRCLRRLRPWSERS